MSQTPRTRLKCIVIADDFSGAAELAGSALRLGLSAEVHLGELGPRECDVVAVDSASRSLSPALAAAEVTRLTESARRHGAGLLFKKVDSALRGPVLAEILAMRAAGRFERCLLVCGNPRKRRLVVDGRILIDGTPLHETAFEHDPEHPCRTSDVVELLTNGVEKKPADSLYQEHHDVRVIAPTDPIDARVSVGNVASADDLWEYAERWFSLRQEILAVGAAEFFEAVLERTLRSRRGALKDSSDLKPAPVASDSILLISGTHSSGARGWPTTRLDASILTSQVARDVCQSLRSHGRCAIFASDLTEGSPAERLQFVREVAVDILAVCRPDQVWIEGGGTASAILRDLGHERLVAVGNAGDGVVALRAVDEDSPTYLVKPGSYPWPGLERHPEPIQT
jgi:uncharacterized protein YgbK (DUF1537 family)